MTFHTVLLLLTEAMAMANGVLAWRRSYARAATPLPLLMPAVWEGDQAIRFWVRDNAGA